MQYRLYVDVIKIKDRSCEAPSFITTAVKIWLWRRCGDGREN